MTSVSVQFNGRDHFERLPQEEFLGHKAASKVTGSRDDDYLPSLSGSSSKNNSSNSSLLPTHGSLTNKGSSSFLSNNSSSKKPATNAQPGSAVGFFSSQDTTAGQLSGQGLFKANRMTLDDRKILKSAEAFLNQISSEEKYKNDPDITSLSHELRDVVENFRKENKKLTEDNIDHINTLIDDMKELKKLLGIEAEEEKVKETTALSG